MHFEINVSKNGLHYFATAPRSLTDWDAAKAATVNFRVRFPTAEGFEIMCTYWETSGKRCTF